MIRVQEVLVQVQVRTNEPSNQASVSRTSKCAYGPYEIYPDSTGNLRLERNGPPMIVYLRRGNYSKVKLNFEKYHIILEKTVVTPRAYV
jgi:hypothetical protein